MPGKQSDPEAPAGWKHVPGQGLIYDGGDDFGLTMVGYVQARYTHAWADDRAATTPESANQFDIPHARVNLRGHVGRRDITYRLQIEAATDSESEDQADSIVKDAYVQYSSDTGGASLRLGQGKTMFGLEGTGWTQGLFFTERSAAAEALSSARTRGAWLMFGRTDARLTLGVMNGDVASGIGAEDADGNPRGFAAVGDDAANKDDEPGYMVNFDLGGAGTAHSLDDLEYWRQFTDEKFFVFGAGYARGNGTPAEVSLRGFDVESNSVNVHLAAGGTNSGGILAEYFLRSDDLDAPAGEREHAQGWSVQVCFADSDAGFGLRFSKVSTDAGKDGNVDYLTGTRGLGATDGVLTEVSAVLDFFHSGHSCKSQIEYTWQDVDPSGAEARSTNHIVAILFQVSF